MQWIVTPLIILTFAEILILNSIDRNGCEKCPC